MVRTQVLKHPPGAGKGKREGEKEMSREEQLPVEQCKRVSVSGSLRGRGSEEMTQLNTFSPWGSEVPLESQRG